MRAVRACEPHTYRSFRFSYPHLNNRRFNTSRRLSREAYPRRYGPAVEPSDPKRGKKGGIGQASDEIPAEEEAEEEVEEEPAPMSSKQGEDLAEESQPGPPQGHDEHADDSRNSELLSPNLDEQREPDTKKGNPPTDHETHESENDGDSSQIEEASSSSTFSSSETSSEQKPEPSTENRTPFEDVLHMPSPSVYLAPPGESSSFDNRPHLSPAPYVHHFDTYSLVQDLTKGGFSDQHSITIMKAVRAILQNNLDLAKESLTSKSDVENEEYLFKAACSELQSSLQTARNSEIQKQRSARTQLQHDMDIISQRVSQDIAGVKDEIKGIFNDHQMNTREQQRSIDTSVKELNYKITVSLTSDGKSEIEGLRWIVTRQAALTIAICACKCLMLYSYCLYQPFRGLLT